MKQSSTNWFLRAHAADQIQVLHTQNSNSQESFEVVRMQKTTLIGSTHNRCKVSIAKQQWVWVCHTRSKLQIEKQASSEFVIY